MHKNNMKKFKSAVISSVLAISAMAAPLSTVVMNASAASDNYAKLLQHSLYFYDANMCGDNTGETSAMTWRDDCHTGDEVNGGFHDAGDHVMFGLPQGYSASTLGWGYYEFKDAYNATGQAAHFKVVSDYFCKFFKDSTKLDGSGNVTNFLYQKGEGDPDHSYWNAPELQEKEQGTRKMYWTSNSASDIAAEYAAALALNYLNFGNAEDLKYAEALYAFSTKYNQVATDGTTPFYSSQNCQDEQAWAAGWLYIATGNESYKTDCANKQVQYLGTNHCWENVSTGAACVYAEITGDWSKVNNWLSGYTNQSGYCFMSEWGSARSNTAMQLTALVASKNSSADYSEWVKNQMDFLLGNNPLNVCYVVGFDSNSAKNPHHRAASGMKGWDEFNASDVITNGHTLVGALVGGPKSADGTNYTDTLKDAVCNEVAVDYNAAFVGAAAGLYSIYKTGTIDTSIDGVDKIYNESVSSPDVSVTTNPVQTTATTTTQQVNNTTTTAAPSNKDITLTKNDMTVGTEKGDDGEMNNYAEFNPQGAKSVTLYYKVNSNDMNTSGAFGTWTGKWEQVDFENVSVPSDGVVAVDYTVPSNVGSTVKAMVFWPHGNAVSIEKVVLHMDGGSSQQTTQPTQSTPPTTTTTTTAAPSNKDITLSKNDMTVGTEEGDDGGMNNYAEFNPQGAKSVTLYYKVNSNDMNTSGAFGTWTGKWEQVDFENASVPSDGIVAVDYTIPSNVGSTVKAMVFWPHGDAVSIEKVVLHMDNTSNQTTTTKQTTTTTTKQNTTTTTTKYNSDVKPTKLGDANNDGKVDIADAVLIMQSISNGDQYKLTDVQRANADVANQGDGLSSMDALAIQMIEAKTITVNDLPITSDKINSLLK